MEESPKDLSVTSSSSSSSVGFEEKITGMNCGEVRTVASNLSGVGAVAKSVGVDCDSSRMSLTAPQRRRLYQESQHSVNREYQTSLASGRRLTVPLPGSGHFQPARRTATFTSHPPAGSAALPTVDRQRKVRHSTSAMDYVPSPDPFCTPDFLKSTFSPSPSSLYMYDQEHPDMHTPLHTARTPLGQMCTSTELTTLTPVEPEFDLHPQYENSNNLEGFFRGALGSNVMPAGACEASVGGQAGGKQEMGLVTISQHDLNKLKPGPTLTELNMDPYLFQDVDAIVIHEGGKLPRGASVLPQKQVDVKTENFAQVQPESDPQKTFTPLKSVRTNQSPATVVRMLHQSQSSPSPSHTSTTSLTQLPTRNRTQNVAVVSPIPVTTPAATHTTIKTEPSDMDKTTDSPSLHKMVTSPPQQNSRVSPPTIAQSPSPPGGRRVMPVVGQSRPPTLGQQGKSGSVEEKWKEIEKFIHDPNGEQAEASAKDRKRKRHASGASTMSDEESVKSQRVGSISDDDFDSDDDSDMSDTPFEESLTELAKKSKQYFWQYNIQAKGPKGTRLPLNISDTDPHHPSNFEDPVFDATNTTLVGIRHGGKARKGDGNEITPNPRKLYQIGQRLCRLNREINNVQLASHLPASVRSKSRKEKNKLSSRACRLKKKAQHEANKIKLFGLNCEQGELLEVIRLLWPCLKDRAKQQMKENIPSSLTSDTLTHQINNIITSQYKTAIAGNTADYVNQVIARVEDGDPVGGLAIKLKVKK